MNSFISSDNTLMLWIFLVVWSEISNNYKWSKKIRNIGIFRV